MKKIITLLVAICLMGTIGISCKKRKGEIGSIDNPVRFYFMPLKQDEVVKKNEAVIVDFLEKATGLKIEAVNAKDFLSIVKAFGQDKADIAFMNTLGFLLARDWAKTQAHLITVYGDIYKNYRGELLVRVDSGIETVANLDGKKVVFADPYSASGYLYALKFFKDNNINPGNTTFAKGHLDAIERLYAGEADVAAVYHTKPTRTGVERDARAELLNKYPDIMTKLKVIALTDEIPNGPVALRHDLPDTIKAKLVGALMQLARTSDGRQALYDLYNVTDLALTSDANYDAVQQVIKSLNKSIEEVVPGGVTFYRTYIETIPSQ
ncbi:MAG: phosphate/phosphite/phosphonate ABC transporter substrate-binding protein [Pseudomonadota bacterium]